MSNKGKLQLEYLAEGVKLSVMSGIYHSPDDGTAFPRPDLYHSHAWQELFLATEDTLRINFTDEIKVVNRGEIIIINKNVIHHASGSDYVNANVSLEYRRQSKCGGMLSGLFDFKKYLVIGADRMAEELFLSYQRAVESASSELAASLLFSLLLRLAEINSGSGDAPSQDGRMNRIYIIEQFLYNCYAGSMPLSMLADRIHISVRQLSRIFREQYGMTYGEKITELRMHSAIRRLLAGEKVSAVAEIVGYKTPSAFHKAFKKYYGVSPSEYKGDAVIEN